ncbi:MAG TPA: hypothetical protein PKM27_13590 [Saprospiraceae bacterium]|nr:hypothetical protein [Saprospiraceae bacterium]HNT21704.1 hypothetical protein [Saprospiraceae bacterium]
MSLLQSLNSRIVLEKAARWYVFIMLNVYGWGKMLGGQFYRRGHLPAEVAGQTLGEANAFDLAWTFMGYSFNYILFVGILQVAGAWLLIWERTKLIGAFILLPILANVVVFDLLFMDKHGATASALLYFSLVLIILFLNRKKILKALSGLMSLDHTLSPGTRMAWLQILAALLTVAVLFGLDQFFVNLFGH